MKYLIAIFLIVALALTACTAEETNNNPATNQNDDNQQNTGETQQGNNNVDVNNDVPETNNQEFNALISKKDSLTYRADYTLKMSGTPDMEMTQYMKGSGKMRIDSEAEGTEARTFMLDKTVYICSNEDEWMCLEFETDETASQEWEEDIQNNWQDYDINSLPAKTIAGTSAKCFGMDVDRSSLEYCLSAEGVTLYMKVTNSVAQDEISLEMIATDYSTSVSDSAFELPAEPQNFEDLLGGMQIPDY